MFMVYGTSGQLFRGSMEQLRKIGSVSAMARAHGVQPVGRDGRDVAEESSSMFFSEHAATTFKDEVHRDALTAYAQTQKINTPRHPLSTVADLMSTVVISLPDTATVWQAWQLLSEKSIGQAPVVNANAQLVGLLTRADLLKPSRLPAPDQHALVWRALMLQKVSELMWTPVPSVTPEGDIRRVARVLLDTGLPGLPVVDEQGQVSGFISRSDILRAVVTDPPLDLWG